VTVKGDPEIAVAVQVPLWQVHLVQGVVVQLVQFVPSVRAVAEQVPLLRQVQAWHVGAVVLLHVDGNGEANVYGAPQTEPVQVPVVVKQGFDWFVAVQAVPAATDTIAQLPEEHWNVWQVRSGEVVRVVQEVLDEAQVVEVQLDVFPAQAQGAQVVPI